MVRRIFCLALLFLVAGLTAVFAAPGQTGNHRSGIEHRRPTQHQRRTGCRRANGQAIVHHTPRHSPAWPADRLNSPGSGIASRLSGTSGGENSDSRRLTSHPVLPLGQPDSLNCRLVGKLQYPQYWDMSMMACVTDNGFCYVAGEDDWNRIGVFDVSNPANISLAGSVTTDIAGIVGLAKSGDYLYAVGDCGLQTFDVHDPHNPVKLGTLVAGDTYAYDLAQQGNYVYIADDQGVRIVNVSNPQNPIQAGYCPLHSGGWRVSVHGSFAYVVAMDGYLNVVDVTNPAAPVLRGQLLPSNYAYNLVAATDWVYLCGDAVIVVDVSNPDSPSEETTVGNMCATTDEISGNYLYVIGDGLYLIDISDPTNPAIAAVYGDVWAYEDGDALSVVGATAYAVNEGGIFVIDCADFGPPVVGSCGAWTGYGVYVKDTFAYVAAYDNGLRVVNIAHPTAPVEVGYAPTPGSPQCVWVQDSFAYVGGLDGTLRIVKVKNPFAPIEVGQFNAGDPVYGVFVKDSFACLACDYSGLKIVKIKNPAAPVLVGSYDTPWRASGVWVQDSLA